MTEVERKTYGHVDPEALAVLMVQGYTVSEAARRQNVDRSTVYRAFKTPEYAQARARLSDGLGEEIHTATVGGLWRVMGRLVADIDNADEDGQPIGSEEDAAEWKARQSGRAELVKAQAQLAKVLLDATREYVPTRVPSTVVGDAAGDEVERRQSPLAGLDEA